tara:strand:+ start:2394 stop:2747 length:354 start_codon:yes stop_codon:yes gene_type:complete
MINTRSPYHLEYENAVTTTTVAVTTTTAAPIATTTTTSALYVRYFVNNFSTSQSVFFNFRSGPGEITSAEVPANTQQNICIYAPQYFYERTSGTTEYVSVETDIACDGTEAHGTFTP